MLTVGNVNAAAFIGHPMISNTILLVQYPGESQRWEALTRAVMSGWDDCPDTQSLVLSNDTADVLDQSHTKYQLAWVQCNGKTSDAELDEALEKLGRWQIPIMVTRENEPYPSGASFQNGTVVARKDDDPQNLQLILRSLLSQSELIREMRMELVFAQRQQGGLIGEIDRMDEEMRLAAGVQREFLPTSLPSLGPVNTGVFFRPASYVSGDIYDCLRLDENHLGFWIADVVGHGVPAALLTMFVKRALPTKEITSNSYRLVPPNEALARLNREMFEHSQVNARFATATYGLINCRTLELQLARAGHPYPLRLRSDGSFEELTCDGPLLAVFPEAEFDLLTVQLEPGDRILMYSDGFEFAFGKPDGDDGKEYRDNLTDLVHQPAESALLHLARAVDAQPGSLHQQDDLTALLVSINKT